jgi:hypothetical protein
MHMTASQALPARTVWRRRTAKYSRWLHIYTSMVSFAVVLFFALTGLTLNHPEWGSSLARTREADGQLDSAWTSRADAEVPRLDVVEFLRRTHHLTGAVADFRVEPADLAVDFKGPGYSADVIIDRASGRYQITESRLGFLAVVNDLHKGRDTGPVWKGLIDVGAGFLALISVTGLLMLAFMHKHRTSGYLLLLAGAAAGYVAYLAWVP